VVIEGMYHEHVVNDEKNQEVLEDYETKKKGEVLSAMKKQGRKLSDKDKDKIANKVVASKGDTSKSDDRYAYEEVDPGMEHNLSILRMLAEKEVNVKDTKKVVDAIRAYDKSKDASRDATDDSDKGDKEGAAIEKKYAAKERGEIKKDDPNWKNKKYHTGMHGESMQHRRNPEGSIKDRFKSRQTDPSKDNFTGIGDSIEDIMKQNAAMKKAAAKKTKKESFSNWRHDLKEIPDYEQIPASAKKRNEKIEEKDVKNTIKINPEMKEETQVDEGVYEKQKTKEVMGALKKRDLKTDVKKKIAADIVKRKGDTSKSDDRYAYESKLWDEVAENLTELGELGGVKYKVVPLDESDIADILARLEKKRISKGGNPDESPLGKKVGRAMKSQQDKARKKAGVE